MRQLILIGGSLLAIGVMAANDLTAAEASDVSTLPIYTRDNAPKTPTVDALPKRKSVSQYGITWTFDQEVPVGQFITGDWYVAGPVSVVKIEPKPLFGDEVDQEWADIDQTEKLEEAFADKKARNGSWLISTFFPYHTS